MKIAISSTGRDLDAQVDARFGRCPCFIVVDPATEDFEVLENTAAGNAGGAGVQAAQIVVNAGVKTVLTGSLGPNAAQVLAAAGVQMHTGVSGTVREALQRHQGGELQATADPAPGATAAPPGGGRPAAMGAGRGGGMGRGGAAVWGAAGPAGRRWFRRRARGRVRLPGLRRTDAPPPGHALFRGALPQMRRRHDTAVMPPAGCKANPQAASGRNGLRRPLDARFGAHQGSRQAARCRHA
jgi:predicted Fe-Mo cluster-binding NifX family protein